MRAFGATQALHFLEGAGVGGAIERRWRGHAELRGIAQAERLQVAPVGQGDELEAGRVAVFAGAGSRRVGLVGVAAVGGAPLEDCPCGACTERFAGFDCSALAGFLQSALPLRLQQNGLLGMKRQQHVVCRGYRRHRGVGTGRAFAQGIGCVAWLHCIDGVVHRQMHHRHRARRAQRIGVAVLGGEDLMRSMVPVDHQLVAARRAPAAFSRRGRRAGVRRT